MGKGDGEVAFTKMRTYVQMNSGLLFKTGYLKYFL